MHQQLWGYKVEWKSVSRGTGGKKVEYHCSRPYTLFEFLNSKVEEERKRTIMLLLPTGIKINEMFTYLDTVP